MSSANRIFWIGVFLTTLTACETSPEEIAARCRAYGFEVGSDHYAACIFNERQAEEMKRKSLLEYGAATHKDSAGSSVVINDQ